MHSSFAFHPVLTLILAAILSPTYAANATCYLRTGDVASKNEPCDPDAEVSHCCEKDKHICFSNNLCLDTAANHFIEGGCTDQTWDNPACPQYCSDNIQTYYGDIRQCDNSLTDWICGVDASDCSRNFTVPQGYVSDKRVEAQTAFLALPLAYTAADATSVSGVTDSAATATVTVTAGSAGTAAPTTDNRSQEKGTSALAAGLGAGLGIGIPLLIALLTSLFFLRRSRKEVAELRNRPRPVFEPVINEVHGDSRPYEKPGSAGVRPYEMGANQTEPSTRSFSFQRSSFAN